MHETIEHRFNIDIAQKVGIPAAIIYNNICHWVRENKANRINFHEGRYWSWNSITAMQEIYPYMTYSQIRTAIETLIKSGYILSGCFNRRHGDRTRWYTTLDIDEKDATNPENNERNVAPGSNYEDDGQEYCQASAIDRSQKLQKSLTETSKIADRNFKNRSPLPLKESLEDKNKDTVLEQTSDKVTIGASQDNTLSFFNKNENQEAQDFVDLWNGQDVKLYPHFTPSGSILATMQEKIIQHGVIKVLSSFSAYQAQAPTMERRYLYLTPISFLERGVDRMANVDTPATVAPVRQDYVQPQPTMRLPPDPELSAEFGAFCEKLKKKEKPKHLLPQISLDNKFRSVYDG